MGSKGFSLIEYSKTEILLDKAPSIQLVFPMEDREDGMESSEEIVERAREFSMLGEQQAGSSSEAEADEIGAGIVSEEVEDEEWEFKIVSKEEYEDSCKLNKMKR